MPEPLSIDGLLPPQMAAKAEDIGVAKGNMPALRMLLLGVMAGAFIGLAAAFATTVTTGNGLDGAVALPYGVMKLLAGLVFCLGLILVVVAGAELFTGNTLLIMAVVSRKLPVSKLLWNWLVVYVGNFAGSVATAYLVLLTAQHYSADGHLGTNALGIAAGKCDLSFTAAFTRGIYCNALVCLAVWLCYSCRTTTDRILAILFPITAFVAMGFEHSVANMYFVPAGIFIKQDAAFLATAGVDATAYAGLNWANFLLRNLVPVTLGNIVGGGVFVGAFYWLIYRQPGTAEEPAAAREFHAASIAERRVADVSRAVGAED